MSRTIEINVTREHLDRSCIGMDAVELALHEHFAFVKGCGFVLCQAVEKDTDMIKTFAIDKKTTQWMDDYLNPEFDKQLFASLTEPWTMILTEQQ